MAKHKPAAKEMLAAAIAERGLSYRRVVKEHGLPAEFSTIHQIIGGTRKPTLELAVAVEREFAIPVESWDHFRKPLTDLFRLRGIAA